MTGPDERRTGDILKGVEPEDLLKFGLIPETSRVDRRTVGLARDLVDLVIYDDVALRPLDVVVGVLPSSFRMMFSTSSPT